MEAEKKDAERQDLLAWAQLGGVSFARVIDWERPDFLCEMRDGSVIGIEHTVALYPSTDTELAPARGQSIQDAIDAKASSAAFYRGNADMDALWLLVVVGRPEDSLLESEEIPVHVPPQTFDVVEVFDPYADRVYRFMPSGL